VKNLDAVLFHPPRSMPAYRKEIPLLGSIFSRLKNEIAVPEYSVMPMGLISLASILEKEGLEAKVVNLGLKYQLKPSLNIERYIKSLNAKVFAVSFNWVFHANSALEIARTCKRLHPNSLVIIGGLTATWFAEEIMRKHLFIDAVLLGECEESIVKFVKNYKGKRLDGVDGIFFRDESRLKINPIKAPPKSLDTYDFINFNLVEDRKEYFKTDIAGFSPQKPPSAWLPIARGCIYNCIFCGGSKEAYNRLTKREEIIFRSPDRICEDVQRLVGQGVRTICFSHDPQLGGEKYYKEIFNGIKKMRIDTSAYIEVFQLPTRNFIKQLTETFSIKPNIAISPETGSENLRKFLGKDFTNRDLLKAINESIRNGIFPAIFFTPGLPGETHNSFTSTLKMIEKITTMCPYLAISSASAYTIDPNCSMAVQPEKYGIQLIFKSLEDYRRLGRKKRLKIIDLIGHETSTLKRQEIAGLVVEALKFTRKT